VPEDVSSVHEESGEEPAEFNEYVETSSPSAFDWYAWMHLALEGIVIPTPFKINIFFPII
jgi:hypothetical protein